MREIVANHLAHSRRCLRAAFLTHIRPCLAQTLARQPGFCLVLEMSHAHTRSCQGLEAV
ncbi:hypothetical protein BKA81DRAFT_371944 [Phyllosticta paracitricarpa]